MVPREQRWSSSAEASPASLPPLAAVHLAGDYLGTSYIETAIETGAAAARRIGGVRASEVSGRISSAR
jgi:hypothetical protein